MRGFRIGLQLVLFKEELSKNRLQTTGREVHMNLIDQFWEFFTGSPRSSGETTVYELLGRVSKISQCIHSNFTPSEVVKEAKLLYENGRDLILGEAVGTPFIGEPVHRVIEELGNILFDPLISHDGAVLSSLIKAYLIFVELTWYQWARNEPTDSGKWLIPDKKRENVLAVAEQLKETVSPVKHAEATFNLKCVKEAASMVPSENPPLHDHLREVLNLVAAAAIEGWAEKWKVLRSADIHMYEMKTAHWYVRFHSLRWMAFHIKTTNELQLIGPDLNDLLREGRGCAESLVVVFMDIMKKHGNDDLRRLVFEGDSELPCLTKLINWGDTNEEFLQTRRLAIGFLIKIANSTKPKYNYHREGSINALIARYKSFKELSGENKDTIKEQLKMLQQQLGSVDEKIALLDISSQGKGKGPDDVKEIKEKMENLVQDQNELKKEKAKLKKLVDLIEERDLLFEVLSCLKDEEAMAIV